MISEKRLLAAGLACIIGICSVTGCAAKEKPLKTTPPADTVKLAGQETKRESETQLPEQEADAEATPRQNINVDALTQALEKHNDYKNDAIINYQQGDVNDMRYWSSLYDTADKQRELLTGMNPGLKKALLKQIYETLSPDESQQVNDDLKDELELYLLAQTMYANELAYEIAQNPKLAEFVHSYQCWGVSKDMVNFMAAPVQTNIMAEDGFSADAPSMFSGLFEAKIVETEECFEEAPQQWNTSEYNTITENGFKQVKSEPWSTFSIDVDTASYTQFKYSVLTGDAIDRDAVKIEEMINYFNFKYDGNKINNEPFIIDTDYTICPWNENHKLLRIGITADEVTEKPDTNFVFVLDVSGSMTQLDKLPLALMAYADLINSMDENDTVSLMYYASGNGVLLDSVSCDKKEEIYDALAKAIMNAGGGTAGAAGLNTAYDLAKKNYKENGVNRVLIATDGDFNIGQTSSSELEKLVEKGRKQGTYLTILGFGSENLKDSKMETMSKSGNGNYHYIGDITDARKALITEKDSTLIPIADDVKIQVEFNPAQVNEYRLIGYENRLLNAEDFNNDKIDAGDVGAGKSVTALYEIVPQGTDGETDVADLKYSSITANETGSDEICCVAIRYKPINSSILNNESKLIEKRVKTNSYNDIPNDNTAFAISIAELGMVLRDSQYKGTATIPSSYALAEAVVGENADVWQQKHLDIMKTLLGE